MQARGSILILDDEKRWVRFCKSVLERYGYSVDATASVDVCKNWLQNRSYDLVLVAGYLDEYVPREGVRAVRAIYPACKVVVLGAAPDGEDVRQAFLLGAWDCVPREYSEHGLLDMVKKASGINRWLRAEAEG